MATEAVTGHTQVEEATRSSGFLSGRARRVLRENLTAYLFLSPALFIIITFGVFPVLFAAYVSLYKWRILQGEYRGIGNYVTAMGDVAYVFFFLIATALIIVSLRTLYTVWKDAKEASIPFIFPLLELIPGAMIAAGFVGIVLRAISLFVREETVEEGLAVTYGNPYLIGGLALVIGGILTSALISRLQHNAVAETSYQVLPNFGSQTFSIILSLGVGLSIAFFTYRELMGAEQTPVALVRIRFLVMGLLLLALGYFIWTWGARQTSNLRLILSLVGAAVMIGAAIYLFQIWDQVSDNGSEDFYLSLSVTVFYALFTVPIQLGISMLLAYLLYQNINSKGLFRILFFIPYIAPTVATAGIFQALFSLRDSGPANSIIGVIGGEPMKWLQESASMFASLAESFGIAGAGDWDLTGPSLALLVIIIYNIWVFIGYDTVIFLAGLGTIPGTLYEAARIDGAGRWELFRHVTFPLLSPTTYFLSVISVIGTFKAFNHVWVLRTVQAQGTTDTASVYFFETFLRASRFGFATAMAMVLLVIILVLTLVQQRIAARRVFYG